jgi:N-acetylglucosamine-6-sulfatase
VDLLYTVWCNNEHELYDITKDPSQMHNILVSSADGAVVGEFPVPKLQTRLDALMMVLKSCKGRAECITPWNILHPQGDVQDLKDAMNANFDTFYANQPKVSYSSCQNGYIIGAEGPQEATPFQ